MYDVSKIISGPKGSFVTMLLKRSPKLGIFLLVVMFFMTTTATSCLDAHAADKAWGSQNQQIGVCSPAASDNHCNPKNSGSSGDHCCLDCNCLCHVPVTAQSIHIEHPISVLSLDISEPFAALPEVFLQMFIPPDILA